jgi:DNA-binding beta-propeller fold protein YncE
MKHTLALFAALSLAGSGCGKGGDSSKQGPGGGENAGDSAGNTAGASDTAPAAAVPKKRQTEKKPLPGDTGAEHSGAHRFSVQLGGRDRESIRALGIDGGGNVVLGGLMAGELEAGGEKLVADEVDAVLFKLDGAGKPVWSRNFGGPGVDIIEAVAIDGGGNIFAGGAYVDELVFGDRSLPAAGADDAFLAKFDADGRRLWAKRLGGEAVDNIHGLAAAADGSVLATGVFSKSMQINETSLDSGGRADGFLASVAGDGALRWARQISGEGDDYGRAIAVAPDGSIYWLVEYSRTATVGPVRLQSAGNRDFAVVKLSPTGEPRWGRGFGGVMDELAVDIAIDPAGDLIVTGSFRDKIDFGGEIEIKSAGETDAFVAKLDGETGEALWARAWGHEREDIGAAVAVDRFGNVAATGWFWNTVDFGGGPAKSTGEKDIFVVKLSPGGDHLWSKTFGGKQVDYARALAFDDAGELLVTGTFYLTVDFGGGPLKANWKGQRIPTGDAYLVKLAR